MIILGIETSCDETALCLLETRESDGIFEYKILGNIVHSQIDLHREFGGVVPILAKREHIKNLPILYQRILDESGIDPKTIGLIAVTQGPGLEPALWTGIAFAGELGKLHDIPVMPINHMEGHIVSTLLSDSQPHKEFKQLKKLDLPAIGILVSGGHTEIIAVEKLGSYKILGQTKDDAIGEAFDKVARLLGLPYPGGPEISKLAAQARSGNIPHIISLPRPMIHSKDLNFSFSGIKTAVLYAVQEIQKNGEISNEQKFDLAREFEDAVTEVLIAKAKAALDEHECRTLIIGGGVIANTHIRDAFKSLAQHYDIPLYLPVSGLTGDNALMIALAGALLPNRLPETKNPSSIAARGNLSLEE